MRAKPRLRHLQMRAEGALRVGNWRRASQRSIANCRLPKIKEKPNQSKPTRLENGAELAEWTWNTNRFGKTRDFTFEDSRRWRKNVLGYKSYSHQFVAFHLARPAEEPALHEMADYCWMLLREHEGLKQALRGGPAATAKEAEAEVGCSVYITGEAQPAGDERLPNDFHWPYQSAPNVRRLVVCIYWQDRAQNTFVFL